jgi:D-3-phosphoglycerate dehydrogenase
LRKIFITTTSFATFSREPLELLEKHDILIELNKEGRKLTRQETPLYLKEYDAVIAGTETYSKETLKQLPNLKVISRLGVGLDNIDMEQAKKQNIKILITQTTPAPAVAELTLGLMLDVLRKISLQNSELKSGRWKKNMGELLFGKTLGIIGLGAIGKKLVKITAGLNFKYLAYDIQKDESFAEKYGIYYCDFEKLLQNSDIVSIHLNLSAETHHLIDYSAFKKMERNAVLINTSRGEIIDEKSLIRALDEKLIQGAGLDVYSHEPYNGPLTNIDNVVLTPHIGAYAKEIRTQMELEAAENLIKGLKNG